MKKQKDYTLLALFIPLVIAILAASCGSKNNDIERQGANDKVILKQVTDERGLTSVIFKYTFDDSDTLAFDYLTPAEFHREFSLPRNIKLPYVCPDCLETGCIYEDINSLVEEGTDSEIMEAIKTVCKERGINNPAIIEMIKREYYL